MEYLVQFFDKQIALNSFNLVEKYKQIVIMNTVTLGRVEGDLQYGLIKINDVQGAQEEV